MDAKYLMQSDLNISKIKVVEKAKVEDCDTCMLCGMLQIVASNLTSLLCQTGVFSDCHNWSNSVYNEITSDFEVHEDLVSSVPIAI